MKEDVKQYRKKPIIITGIKWTGKNLFDVYSFMHGKPPILDCRMAEDRWEDYERMIGSDGLFFKTLESDGETQKADIGDNILKGIDGECYPIKPDILEKTYDEVKSIT